MTGKTVLITGASSGIGAVAAGELVRAGATVIPVGRSPERTRRAAEAWGVTPYLADFARFDSVRAVARQIAADHPVIDVIAHNAGGFYGERADTIDGHELTMQTNYFSAFLLNHLLIDRVLAAPAPRIVITSSAMHRLGGLRVDDLDARSGRYSGAKTYSASKLAGILFATELTRRYADQRLAAVAFHPGVVATGIGGDSPAGPRPDRTVASASWYQRTPEEGARPLVHLITTPDATRVAGAYFSRMRRVRPSGRARDAALARDLWNRTEQAIALTPSID